MPHDPPADSRHDCPYRVLADVGVTPRSSMKEILDCSFQLMRQDRWTPEVRSAWNELRMIEHRLVADFLCDTGADGDARFSRPGTSLLDMLVRDPGELEYDR